METVWQPLLTWLENNPHWLLLSFFLVAFLESVAIAGLLVPGMLIIWALSAIAGNADINVWPILAVVAAGAILGDGLSFYLGKKFHQKIRMIRPFSTHPEWIRGGEIFFQKHGGKSVLFGRFMGPMRPIVPVIAGMLDMARSQFLFANIVSALLWSPVTILPLYFFGTAVRHQYLPTSVLHALVWIVVLGSIGFYVLKKLHWQVQPEQYLYQKIKTIILRNHSLSYWWQRLARRHHTQAEPIFPLGNLLGVFGLALSLLCVLLLNGFTNIFANIDIFLQQWIGRGADSMVSRIISVFYLLGNATWLLITTTCLGCWLLLKKNYAAILHLLVTLIVITLLAFGMQYLHQWLADDAEKILQFLPNLHTSLTTGIYSLLALFISHELVPKRRWLVYSVIAFLVLCLVMPDFFFSAAPMVNILTGILLGGVVANAVGFHYYRFDQYHLHLDKSAIFLGLAWLIGTIGYVWYSYPAPSV